MSISAEITQKLVILDKCKFLFDILALSNSLGTDIYRAQITRTRPQGIQNCSQGTLECTKTGKR